MMGLDDIVGGAEPKAPEEKLSIRTENELRAVERTLEEIGQNICGAPRSFVPYGHIDLALNEVRSAIRNCYLMDEEYQE